MLAQYCDIYLYLYYLFLYQILQIGTRLANAHTSSRFMFSYKTISVQPEPTMFSLKTKIVLPLAGTKLNFVHFRRIIFRRQRHSGISLSHWRCVYINGQSEKFYYYLRTELYYNKRQILLFFYVILCTMHSKYANSSGNGSALIHITWCLTSDVLQLSLTA